MNGAVLLVAAIQAFSIVALALRVSSRGRSMNNRSVKGVLILLIVVTAVSLGWLMFSATSSWSAKKQNHNLHERRGSRWQLMDCINQNQDTNRVGTWFHAMIDETMSI